MKSESISRRTSKQNNPHHQYGFSTQHDDNFLSLECDENLYEEDHLIYNLEGEKVGTHPPKSKQTFVGPQATKEHQHINNHQNNIANDTIPDFGYMSNHKEEDTSSQLRNNQIIINKEQPEIRTKKIPPKNCSSNDENMDPFISIAMNPEEESPAKLDDKAQEDEEFSRRISSIAEQYDFNYGFNQGEENPEDNETDFMFAHID